MLACRHVLPNADRPHDRHRRCVNGFNGLHRSALQRSTSRLLMSGDGRSLVIHLIAEGLEPGGGLAYAVPRLRQSLIDSGHDVHLHALETASRGGSDSYSTILPRSLGISPELKSAFRAVASTADVLHVHGIWGHALGHPALLRDRYRYKVVLSPHGMLEPWALGHHRFRKRLMWMARTKRVVDRSHMLHATSLSERDAIRAVGFMGPIAIVPNGIDVPVVSPTPPEHGQGPFVLSLGRLHPKKGLDMLLRAWKVVGAAHKDWRLVIAGPGEARYRKSLEVLTTQLGLPRVEFRGPVFGAEKQRLYEAASLFVLPTHSENFGLVVAEALAQATPVVVTKGAPWSSLESRGCGWWVDIGVAPLIAAMDEAMELSAIDRQMMGNRGREWVEKDFSWETVAGLMVESYRWLIDGGPVPGWIDGGGKAS